MVRYIGVVGSARIVRDLLKSLVTTVTTHDVSKNNYQVSHLYARYLCSRDALGLKADNLIFISNYNPLPIKYRIRISFTE